MRLSTALAVCLGLASVARADPRVTDQSLRVRLDPAERGVSGASEMRVVPEAGGVLALELATGLRITSVRRDGARVEPVVDADRGDGVTVWRFPATPRAGAGDDDIAVVLVEWSGTVPEQPGRTFREGAIDLGTSTPWCPIPASPFTWTAELDVPRNIRCVLRGEATGRSEDEQRARESWRGTIAASVLPLAAGRWESVSAGAVTVWGPEPDRGLLAAAGETYARIADVLGPCPAPRWNVLPESSLAASSAPGFASPAWGDLGVQAARCWWGLAVLDAPGRERWTDALARYTALHLAAHPLAASRAHTDRKECLAQLAAETPAADDRRRQVAFQAIRQEIGEDAFLNALRAVLRDRSGRDVTWDVWARAFGDAAGHDVTASVKQWAHRRGAPFLSLRGVTIATVSGRVRVSGTIRQTLGGDDEAPWRMTVPVEIETVGGPERLDVALGSASTGFTAIVESLPLRVSLDPEHEVLRRLAREPGGTPVEGPHTVTPDTRSAADVRRILDLGKRMRGSPDVAAALKAAVDELRLAGCAVRSRRLDVEVRARATEDVVTVDGAPVARCRPLTCSPSTAEEGRIVRGIASDVADDLTDRALVVDVPRSTSDLPAFARGFADIARGAGAAALVLRVHADDETRLSAAWATPAEAPEGVSDPVLFARAAQLPGGAELPLPAVVAPRDFAPAGELRVRVRWTTETARVTWAQAEVDAPNGRGGPLLLVTRVGPDRSVDAALVTEAVQLLSPHAVLLGRDVVVGLLPDDDGTDASLAALLRSLDAPPAATVWIGELAGELGETSRERGDRLGEAFVTCLHGSWNRIRSGGSLSLPTTRLSSRILVADTSAVGHPVETPPDARAHHLALAVLALSVTP